MDKLITGVAREFVSIFYDVLVWGNNRLSIKNSPLQDEN